VVGAGQLELRQPLLGHLQAVEAVLVHVAVVQVVELDVELGESGEVGQGRRRLAGRELLLG